MEQECEPQEAPVGQKEHHQSLQTLQKALQVLSTAYLKFIENGNQDKGCDSNTSGRRQGRQTFLELLHQEPKRQAEILHAETGQAKRVHSQGALRANSCPQSQRQIPRLQVSHVLFPSALHVCSSATALGQHEALHVRYYAWLMKTHNR